MKYFSTKQTIVFVVFLLFCFDVSASDVVFRYDDFQLVDNDLQKEMLEVFEKNRIPISLGVVPFDDSGRLILSEDFVRTGMPHLLELERQGLIEIALHGYSHTLRTEGGEFGGLPYAAQRELLSKGKETLDSLFSTTINSFIPPWNNYDENTLTILDSLGIRVISSCMTIGQSFDNESITYFPTSVGTFNAFSSFQEAVKVNGSRKGLIVFMFYPYDFEDFSIEELDHMLKDISENPDITCMTFTQLLNNGEKSDKVRMEANIEVNLLTKLLGTSTIILPTWVARLIKVVNILIYTLVALLTCIFVNLGYKRLKKKIVPGLLICMALVFGLVVLCIWFHFWSPLKTLLAVIMLPIVWGVSGAILESRFRGDKSYK